MLPRRDDSNLALYDRESCVWPSLLRWSSSTSEFHPVFVDIQRLAYSWTTSLVAQQIALEIVRISFLWPVSGSSETTERAKEKGQRSVLPFLIQTLNVRWFQYMTRNLICRSIARNCSPSLIGGGGGLWERRRRPKYRRKLRRTYRRTCTDRTVLSAGAESRTVSCDSFPTGTKKNALSCADEIRICSNVASNLFEYVRRDGLSQTKQKMSKQQNFLYT